MYVTSVTDSKNCAHAECLKGKQNVTQNTAVSWTGIC